MMKRILTTLILATNADGIIYDHSAKRVPVSIRWTRTKWRTWIRSCGRRWPGGGSVLTMGVMERAPRPALSKATEELGMSSREEYS